MIQFVFAIIIWLVMACLIIASLVPDNDSKAACVAGAIICVILGFGLFTWAGLKSVPVKNIGVSTSYGAVGSGVFGPGVHQTWTPWLSITDIDETVQTTTYKDTGNDSGSSCNGGLPVRIGGQQTACADLTIQWQILPPAAGSLFSDYANHGDLMKEITSAVVVRELEQVANNVLGDYDPITDVQSVTNTNSATSQFTGFSTTILTDMRADIGTRIKVLTVLMPQLHYTTAIEDKLSAIQQAYANFAIAEENVKVNAENAQALVKLGTPNVNQLIAQCLTDVKSEPNLPTGFECFPGAASGLALSGK